jgi:hypothetical protein
MTERMLLEALIEHHGIATIVQLIEQICDAKAAEMVAYGDIKAAKMWAAYAAKVTP